MPLFLGFLGVLAFSFTLPATRRTPITVRGGQDGGRGPHRDTRTTRSLIVLGDDRFPAASVAAIVAR